MGDPTLIPTHIRYHPPPMTRARTSYTQTVPTHFTKRSEAMGFGEILQWLQDNHMGDIAIEVASTGVEDMATLRNMSVDLMKTHEISMGQHQTPLGRPPWT